MDLNEGAYPHVCHSFFFLQYQTETFLINFIRCEFDAMNWCFFPRLIYHQFLGSHQASL